MRTLLVTTQRQLNEVARNAHGATSPSSRSGRGDISPIEAARVMSADRLSDAEEVIPLPMLRIEIGQLYQTWLEELPPTADAQPRGGGAAAEASDAVDCSRRAADGSRAARDFGTFLRAHFVKRYGLCSVAKARQEALTTAARYHLEEGHGLQLLLFDVLLGVASGSSPPAPPQCRFFACCLRRVLQFATTSKLQALMAGPQALVAVAGCRKLPSLLFPASSVACRRLQEQLYRLHESPPARLGAASSKFISTQGTPAVALEVLMPLLMHAWDEFHANGEENARAAFMAALPDGGAITFQNFCELLRTNLGATCSEDELLRMYEHAVALSCSVLGAESDTILVGAFTHVCHAQGLI